MATGGASELHFARCFTCPLAGAAALRRLRAFALVLLSSCRRASPCSRRVAALVAAALVAAAFATAALVAPARGADLPPVLEPDEWLLTAEDGVGVVAG